jgi:hypothetical protein
VDPIDSTLSWDHSDHRERDAFIASACQAGVRSASALVRRLSGPVVAHRQHPFDHSLKAPAARLSKARRFAGRETVRPPDAGASHPCVAELLPCH